MWSFLAFARIQRVDQKLDRLLKELRIMSKEFDDLKTAVAAENTVIDSAVTLLQGLAAQVAALPADAKAIADLAAEIRAKSDSVAQAIVANTPTPIA